MVTDRLAQAVREQLGLGRLLPLGRPADGAWVTEQAAGRVLRHAAEAVPVARLDELRIGMAHPDRASRSFVPPPPSALPPGPLRVDATFAALAGDPLPETADRLRNTLFTAATQRLGLDVEVVDLCVTALLDAPAAPGPAPAGPDGAEAVEVPPAAVAVAAAATAVPGVTRLAPVGSRQPVLIEDRTDASGAPTGRHVQVQVAVAADHRAVDVALAVRMAAGRAVGAPATVTVLVTAVDQWPGGTDRPVMSAGT